MSIGSLPEKLRLHFDASSPEYGNDIDESNRMLRQCPVVHSDQHGGFWVFSRHADVVAVMRNHKVFSSAAGIFIPPSSHLVPAIPTESDEPLHAQYRQILWPFLAPHAVAKYEAFIRATAVGLIDHVIDDGHMDVLGDFASPLPSRVTGQFFGMSGEDGERCWRWSAIMMEENVENPDLAKTAAVEFFEFLQETIDEARRNPGNTLIHAIVSGTVGGRPLSNDEVLGMLFTSIIGALETTVGAIALGVNLLGRYPDQRARLVADPSLMPLAVEEVLRIEPSAGAAARTVLAETEVAGVHLHPGERVQMLFRSANHDEAVFEEPESFQVDRGDDNHIAFGYGVHKCIGQHLARLEIQVAFEELLRRIPDFRVEGDPQPHMRGGISWGLSELEISWD